MRLASEMLDDFRDGFAQLHDDFDVPGDFSPEVLEAAEIAAQRPVGDGASPHVDRTDLHFLTLDPASSTDLDQAFAIEMTGSGDGADVILHYAIADVGWFVRPGDPIDHEAWRRGVTVYMPHERAGLHPPRIAEDAGSLLPGSPKPAVVFVVRITPDGSVTLDGVERAMIQNRAKLAYSTVTPADLPDSFPELARRFEIGESARGADRIQMPEQEVVRTEHGGQHGYELRFRPRNDAENQNAAMSLATNMAVADALHAAGTGLFRTMPAVDERRLGRLRHTARAFGLDWPKAQSLPEFEKSLPAGDPKTSAFQLSVRRASGGASYEPFDPNKKPWHAAVAATYSHATAPLRRLADRYVIEAALAVGNGEKVSDEIEQAFVDLPQAMRQGDTRANRVDRAAIDLAEAIVLHGREGEVFDAVVTDEDDRGARIQVIDPAIVARVVARRVDPGDDIQVKLITADPAERRIEFERVG
jgi:exoribonuclease R